MAFVAPAAGVFDAPAVSISLNEEWRSFVLGVVKSLLSPPEYGLSASGVYAAKSDPVWAGDENAVYAADQEIEKLLNALAKGQNIMALPGMIQMYLGAIAPAGWLLCDGTIYAKADYPALWGVLSISGNFEEDDDNFIAPDMRGRFPIGNDDNDYPLGQFGGLNSIPLHSHSVHGHGAPFNAAAGSTPVSTPGANTTTGNYGGGNQHENLPPYIVLNFIIKT